MGRLLNRRRPPPRFERGEFYRRAGEAFYSDFTAERVDYELAAFLLADAIAASLAPPSSAAARALPATADMVPASASYLAAMSAGREFVGPYRMFHLIRAGALFEIWAVRPVAETNAFAMKWLPPGSRYDRATAGQLKHEYEVGKTLDHPSIIKTYDFGNGKDGAYLIMELFKTPNLKQQIQGQLEHLHWRLDRILLECAEALEYMHQKGWVHRDIKPDNFLVNEENHIRLIDFNLTRRLKSGLGKLLGGKSPIQGTYSYMSPEQIRGVSVDERADIYSFGCMVYELISGKLPFTATSPSELLNKHLRTKPTAISVLNKNVHADFADLLHRMLSKEPKDRPDSLKEFIRDLKAGRVFQVKPRKPLPKIEPGAEPDS